jgi:8-oxo-dGTP diphosphatase
MAIQGFLQVVACALVDQDGRVLLTSRPEGKSMAGYYEFPGGKIEVGETPEQALIRELREEISIETSASCLAPFSFVSYGFEQTHVVVLLYICRKWKGFVTPLEGQAYKWVKPRELPDQNLLAGNVPFIVPLIELLG